MSYCNEEGCQKRAVFLVIAKENAVSRYAAYACVRHVGSQVDYSIGSIYSHPYSELSYEVTTVEPPNVCRAMGETGVPCHYDRNHRSVHSFEPDPF